MTQDTDASAAESLDAPARLSRAAQLMRTPSGAPLLGMWFLPTVALVIMLVAIFSIQPTAFSYTGLSLVLGGSFPLVLAALAQMFVIAGGDIDLGIGSFVSLVNVIFAVTLEKNVLLGTLFLIGLVVANALIGVLITVRRLPSIVVTLGMAFIWLGIAITILPNPGGTVPAPIVSFVNLSPPVIPGVVLGIVIVTIVTSWFLMRTRYGAVLRATGSNPEAVTRAGWSVLKAKIVLYGIAGIFGVLSGMVLSGQATSGDPNIAQSYILLSIAGVIVGGGSFAGGDVSPGGTVAGALVIGLMAALLQFLNISSNYQVGAQGLTLVVILLFRVGLSLLRRGRQSRITEART